jgi:hypothetical protein
MVVHREKQMLDGLVSTHCKRFVWAEFSTLSCGILLHSNINGFTPKR